ncbi:MAG TPA: DedA family protein [Gemmatimonadales bacterium]|jgi:membrane protein DedA with SNARE-associated domain
MDLNTWIHAAGGPLLLVGAWLQGEAAVILGGALARQGYWPWWEVWLLASIPAAVGHQIYYLLGRRYGEAVLTRVPARLQPAFSRANALVRRHEIRVLVLMRFAYGVRLPLPILCGASGVAPGKFLCYNVATALSWALLFTLTGLLFGAAATVAFRHYAHFQALFLFGSVVFAALIHFASQRSGARITAETP